MGPILAVWMITAPSEENSPGLAFIVRVFSTSNGCVKEVAMAPCQKLRDDVIMYDQTIKW